MDEKSLSITCIPEISAIYFALLQTGYEFFSLDREEKHVQTIRAFRSSTGVPAFFREVRQNTCEVYPFWPRAAILETATFFLRSDRRQFSDFDAFRSRIMSAKNISEPERDHLLWEWITDFPDALAEVLSSDEFRRYLAWEEAWIAAQNATCQKELSALSRCLDGCRERYHSPVREIQIVLNPIKCVYSSDYHLIDGRFVFTSGSFDAASILHEFLHHVVHPHVSAFEKDVLERKPAFPGLDASYYLTGNAAGWLNAFEEYAVRTLTEDVQKGSFPHDLTACLRELMDGFPRA